MPNSRRLNPGWQTSVLAVLVFLWLGLSTLLIVGWGDPEAALLRGFGRSSRVDAFAHLNNILSRFWAMHTSLVLVAMAAARSRRSDVLAVFQIGPVIALMVGALAQDWSDPNWFEVVAICEIGWLVSLVVGGAYWILRPGPRPK